MNNSRNLKLNAIDSLLICGGIFVLVCIGRAFLNQATFRQTMAINQTFQMDVKLRVTAAGECSARLWNAYYKQHSTAGQKAFEQCLAETRTSFASMDVANSMVLADKVILYERINLPDDAPLAALRSSSSAGDRLAQSLAFVFAPGTGSADDTDSQQLSAADVEIGIKKTMLPSWFTDYALQRLYIKTAQTAKLDALTASQTSYYVRLVWFAWAVLLANAFVGIAGLVTVVVHSIKLWQGRRANLATDVPPSGPSHQFAFRAIAGVLIAFLVTKMLAKVFIGGWYADPVITPDNVFTDCAELILMYSLVNGSGLFYFWLFAVRPGATRFLDAIDLRLSTAAHTFPRLILIGIGTACTACLFYMILAMIGLAFGFKASANPFGIYLSAAANASDGPSIAVLFVLISLVVPFVEEGFVRGFFYGALRQRYSALVCVVVSALFFAGLHFDLPGFLFLFGFGVLTAYVRERTQSTLPTMIAHAVYMCFSFAQVLCLRAR